MHSFLIDLKDFGQFSAQYHRCVEAGWYFCFEIIELIIVGNSLGKVGLVQRIVVAAGLLIRVGNRRRPIYSKYPDS